MADSIARSPLTELLKAVLVEKSLDFEEAEGGNAFSVDYEFEDVSWLLFLQAIEDMGLVVVYSSCPFTIEEKDTAAILEFSSRISYVLLEGNFELDPDDGDLRFKTSVFVGSTAQPTEISDEDAKTLIAHSIFYNIFMATVSFPSVAKICHGLVSITDAVRDASELN